MHCCRPQQLPRYEIQTFMFPEVLEVLDVEGGEGKSAGQAASRDPAVVSWPGSPPAAGRSGDPAPRS